MNWRNWALMAVGAFLLVALGAFVVGPLLQGERGREDVPVAPGEEGERPDPTRSPTQGATPPDGPAEGRPGVMPPEGGAGEDDFEPGAPERVGILSEVPDTALVGAELPTPVTIRVGDDLNLPVPEASVAFTVLEGEGLLERTEDETGEVGTARLRYTPESEGHHLLEVRLQATGDTALASFHAVRDP